MTTVFLAGSRNISRLNDLIRNRVDNMIRKGFRIIIGDANGADKALQKHLADSGYSNVVVYCSGDTCRNNVGNWQVRRVKVDSKIKGREFYTQKDKVMACEGDYGFMLWDGKSAGTISNVVELVKREKKALVYLSWEKKFQQVSSLEETCKLLERVEKTSVKKICSKLKLDESTLREIERITQASLGF